MDNLLKFREPLIKVGFTGTQVGMTEKQKKNFRILFLELYNNYEKIEFHHGDCVGADKDAHDIVKMFGGFIVIHPPIMSIKRAFCKGDKILERKEYLERNHDIVNETDILIVAPESNHQVLRSGTWATYRYAKKVRTNDKIKILNPGD